jgi:hypothetical protein
MNYKIKPTKHYHEGYKAFGKGVLLIDNPYGTQINTAPWQWSFGWHDALAARVRGNDS